MMAQVSNHAYRKVGAGSPETLGPFRSERKKSPLKMASARSAAKVEKTADSTNQENAQQAKAGQEQGRGFSNDRGKTYIERPGSGGGKVFEKVILREL